MDFLTIIIFIVVFVAIFKLAMIFSSEEKINKKRIAEILENKSDDFEELEEEFGKDKSSTAILLEKFVSPFRNVENDIAKMKLKLLRAGWSSSDAPSYYLFFATYGWLFGIIIAFVFYSAAQKYEGTIQYVIYGMAVFNIILFTLGAQLAIENSIQKRQEKITHSFPDALDLLMVCVESGLSVDAALARVCKELKYVHPEITQEFNKTRYELAILNDREKAFSNLSKRANNTAFKSLVTAFVQAEKYGVSLVETLRVLSEDYRNARMVLAEEKAAKLPTKITVVSIPLMILALMILIASPAAIKLMN